MPMMSGGRPDVSMNSGADFSMAGVDNDKAVGAEDEILVDVCIAETAMESTDTQKHGSNL